MKNFYQWLQETNNDSYEYEFSLNDDGNIEFPYEPRLTPEDEEDDIEKIYKLLGGKQKLNDLDFKLKKEDLFGTISLVYRDTDFMSPPPIHIRDINNQQKLDEFIKKSLEFMKNPDPIGIFKNKNKQNQTEPQQPKSQNLSDLLKLNDQQKNYLKNNFEIVPNAEILILNHKPTNKKVQIKKVFADDNNKVEFPVFKREILALISSQNPQQPNQQQQQKQQTGNSFSLKQLGIKENEVEIIKFPQQNKTGVRNRKKGSPGFGSIHYFDHKSGDINKFSQELRKSFGT